MRNEESFIHFLKTGELGPLNFSLSIEDVYEKIGPPEKTYRPFSYMGEGHDKQVNLYYKSLIIAFYENVLVQFLFDFNKRRKGLPRRLNARWYSAIKREDYLFFVNYLKKHDISCKRIITPNDDEEKTLYIKHNDRQDIVIAFDPDKKDRIISIICTDGEPGKSWQFEDC